MYATVQKCGWVTGSQELQKTGCYSLIGSHICDGEFSRLFPLLIKYIGLNLHKAHKGPKTSLQNCHLFHIIPLGPMDLVFLLLFWLPLEKKGKRDSIHNKIHIRKSSPHFLNVNTSLDYSLQDRCLLPAFKLQKSTFSRDVQLKLKKGSHLFYSMRHTRIREQDLES